MDRLCNLPEVIQWAPGMGKTRWQVFLLWPQCTKWWKDPHGILRLSPPSQGHKMHCLTLSPLVYFVGWKAMPGLSSADGKVSLKSGKEVSSGPVSSRAPKEKGLPTSRCRGSPHLSGYSQAMDPSNTEGCLIFALAAFCKHLHSHTSHPLLRLFTELLHLVAGELLQGREWPHLSSYYSFTQGSAYHKH